MSSRLGPHDEDPEEEVRLLVPHHLDHPLGPAQGEGPATGGEGELPHLHLVARPLRFLLGEAHPGPLGGGVDHARDLVVKGAVLAGGVLGGDEPLPHGLVGEEGGRAASPMA